MKKLTVRLRAAWHAFLHPDLSHAPAEALTPPVLNETINRWALDMQREFDENAHKGTPGSWMDCHPEDLWNEVMYHAAKMIYAMKHGDTAKVREFGADVANMAHMTVDAWYAQKVGVRPAEVSDE